MIETGIQQTLGRAKNAVQEFLIRKLLVPKIYLDAPWSTHSVDVLAVDRAGVGDVYAVEIKDYLARSFPDYSDIPDERTIRELNGLPAHYKYLALATDSPDWLRFSPNAEVGLKGLAPDGVGRIGILIVDFSQPTIAVEEKLKPERFRSSKEVVDLADQFVAGHIANWEVRDEPTAAP